MIGLWFTNSLITTIIVIFLICGYFSNGIMMIFYVYKILPDSAKR